VGRVLVPLPDRDFDVTEVAVPWRLLTEAGHEVVFATQRGGQAPQGDPRLLTGVLFGRLGAREEPKEFYRSMTGEAGYRSPLCWTELRPEDYDGLLLPGGHAPGMRQYLGSADLCETVAQFWALGRPVAAICHGPIVLARTVDPATGRSVLDGRSSTCLTKYLERTAYYLTAWRLGRYYRTYPAYVQDEVTAALGPTGRFVRGPRPSATQRDTRQNSAPAFVLRDGNYLSARWPGDAYTFGTQFADMLSG
jgi:putative intracellular protease/amidase